MNGVEARMVYEFGPFRLDPVERRLLADGMQLAITPKALETLLMLLSRPGDVLNKEELIDAVWGEVAVEENNLTQQISVLRRAIGRRSIVTVPGRGYTFVAPVHQVEVKPSSDLLVVERT